MVTVSVKNISKVIAGKTILDDVSFEIKDKTFTSILGPVGAGKTTLLRIIAGVEKPDKGTILFDGEDVTKLPARERNVAMVYQNFALYPHMSVYDNIASPLKIKKMSKNEIDKRVQDVTELLRITHLLNRKPAELSGGECQRVAIARALIKNADIYLFDEPLTNLDYKIREEMRGELRKIFREKGGTILFATSDPLDTFAMAKYVIILHEGKVLQSGTVQEVYSQPKNKTVGRILGRPPMNFIDAELKKADDKIFIDIFGNTVDVTALKHLLEDQEYVLGIRPDNVFIVKPPTGNFVRFNAKVIVTEIEGSESVIHLDWNGQRIIAYHPYITRLESGERIEAFVNLSDIYIFKKSTGEFITKYIGGGLNG